MFGFSAFADTPFASLPSAGQTGILGSLALTLDDITVSATGTVTHVNSGSLTLVLDDLLIAVTGNVVSSNNGTLALTLDDVFIEITGLIGSNFITITLEDILFTSDGTVEPAPVTFTQTKGGIKAKKKEYKNNSADVKKAIEDAVEAVTGEPKPKVKVAPKVEEEINTFSEDYEAILRMETEKAALEIAIAQMLEDERDDEEAILLLL